MTTGVAMQQLNSAAPPAPNGPMSPGTGQAQNTASNQPAYQVDPLGSTMDYCTLNSCGTHLQYESPSSNLISAANQSFTNESAGSLTSQATSTSSSSNSTTNKILYITVAVNAALLACFAVALGLELSGKTSQPVEERGGTEEFKAIQKEIWNSDKRAFDAKREAEKIASGQVGILPNGEFELAKLLEPPPGKAITNTPLHEWLWSKPELRDRDKLSRERLKRAFESDNIGKLKFTKKDAEDYSEVEHIFNRPHVAYAFALAATDANPETIEDKAATINIISGDQLTKHVNLFKTFIHGAIR